jgi:hypothetical protein
LRPTIWYPKTEVGHGEKESATPCHIQTYKSVLAEGEKKRNAAFSRGLSLMMAAQALFPQSPYQAMSRIRRPIHTDCDTTENDQSIKEASRSIRRLYQ